ncbi:MAG: SEL1-like repeat protein [Hyphomicrobiales bacterium]|nr:SEL1-like repeat protein [Hyphomicrobiales bacterium]
MPSRKATGFALVCTAALSFAVNPALAQTSATGAASTQGLAASTTKLAASTQTPGAKQDGKATPAPSAKPLAKSGTGGASAKPSKTPDRASDGGTPSAAESTPPRAAATAGSAKERDWRRTGLPADAAYSAFQRGYFITAFKEATKRIEANTPDAPAAMTLIGELYRDGLGFHEDPAEAARWYALAAKRGDAQAAFAMGRAYLSGRGVKQDPKKAREFFEQAAAKHVGAALYNLGIMAMEPRKDKTGEIVNYREAAGYFQKAVEQGDLDAAYALALLYRSGRGVPRNDIKAAELLKHAADQHHLIAETEYAIVLFNGKGVKKDEAAAAKYFERAAWRNSPVAQNRLARMYAAGRGVKRDIMQAMKWHIIARASGLKDKWLDDKLPTLTRTQRQLVNEQVRKFATK